MADRQTNGIPKMAKLIDFAFKLWTRVGRRNSSIVFPRQTWQIGLKGPSATAMQPYVRLL